jgi:hypothetical protein
VHAWPTAALKRPPQPHNTFSGPCAQRGPLRAPRGMCPSNFFRHPCPIPRPDFAHPLRTTCVQGPFCCPPGELGSDQCPLRARGFCLKPCYSRSGMVASPRMAGLGSRRPSKMPPYRDWLSACTKINSPKTPSLGPTPCEPHSGHARACAHHFLPPPLPHSQTRFCAMGVSLYLLVCAGMCMYMHVYACMCNYVHVLHVCACVCMFLKECTIDTMPFDILNSQNGSVVHTTLYHLRI